MKSHNFSHRVAAAILVLLVAAVPALGNAIAGCIVPLIPKPDVLLKQAWSPSQLMTTLGQVTELNFRTSSKQVIMVVPHYSVFTRAGGSNAVQAGKGTAVKVQPGTQPLGAVFGASTLSGAGRALTRTVDQLRLGSGGLQVIETRVQDPKTRLTRWPRGAEISVELSLTDAEVRETPTHSHRLVVFLAPSARGDGGAVVPRALFHRNDTGIALALLAFAAMALGAATALRRPAGRRAQAS